MDHNNFRAMRISLASPDIIRSWSYGEVTKPETINYRRLRPEKDGLFCEAIFGPTKDWQCYCGKYKNVRYRGVVCDKCGVEVTRSAVRRERMGHIELVAPVAHIWYTRRVPSYLGLLLDITRRNLDRVLYFAQYAIVQVDEEARARALKRLEDEFERERKRLEGEMEGRLSQTEAELSSQVSTLTDELLLLRKELDDRLSAQTEAIMGEAKMLSASLENQMGKPAREDLSVSFGNQAMIVLDGEKVTREHTTRLNELVQGELSRLQDQVQQEREDAAVRLDALNEGVRSTVAAQKGELQESYAAELEALQTQYDDDVDELKSLAPMQFFGEARYRELKAKWGNVFRAGMGAEAFYEYLQEIELDKLSEELWHEVRHGRSKQRRQRATKRLRIVEALRESGNRPEWMILTVLPVIPPELRPMVQLDGGRFATSDLNDLYRRVINRNNRLRRLLDLGAPDVIVRNEKRMLQESVDSLIDNSRRGKAMSRRGRRELKSLSDMLKGKKGRFRRNLLGKRVDYSGRSVIVIGPRLKMHQCGLPKEMALELYRPFVIAKLVEYNYASNVKGARRIMERERPEVWEVLEEVIRDRPVLLNRAPTLHRLGIQAFEPLLVEGKAIQLHPLACSAFNADFDGDQMAVHVPLSQHAVREAYELMLSTRNLLKPADGEPVIGPSKDMVLGCYYLTMEREGERGEGMAFADMDEVRLAYNLGKVALHAKIKLQSWSPERDSARAPIETTVGRVLFNDALPEQLRFVNEVQEKGSLKKLLLLAFQRLGQEATAEMADRIKDVGFGYATRSGTSIAMSDLIVPPKKYQILETAEKQVGEVERQFRRGLLTDDEQYTRTIELWTDARDEVESAVKEVMDVSGPIFVMASSGSTKGGFTPIAQLAGMRGLMADPSGRIIDLPIRSSFREGLTALEYFISTHGSRKGLADTALRTADAGYLTRRLVDVAQDMVINARDCGTRAGLWVRGEDNASDPNLPQMGERILGRVLAGDVSDPRTGELLYERNTLLDEAAVARIKEAGVEEVFVRSPLTCQLGQGLCQLCYGRDLGRGTMVELGSAVGIVAAQSIGEPGTQLTLRTFHTGGIAHGGDITHGLPRVEELLEARKHPKGEAIMAEMGGRVEIHRGQDGARTVKVIDSRLMQDAYPLKRGWKVVLEEEQEEVEAGEVIATRGEKELVVATGGRVVRDPEGITVVYDEREEQEYEIPSSSRLLVSEGEVVEAGTQLTEGTKNPHNILEVLGREATQRYMLQEVQKVYRSQGVNIHDKHFEVIVSRMLSKVQVSACGDTDLLPGDLVDRMVFAEANEKVLAEGGEPASATPVLLGVTKAALNTESFLSAASFQHTIRVLAGAAIAGKRDELLGLKENVIIGKLIPAGTGFWNAETNILAAGTQPETEALPEGIEQELAEMAQEASLGLGLSGLPGADADTELALDVLGEGASGLGGTDQDQDLDMDDLLALLGGADADSDSSDDESEE